MTSSDSVVQNLQPQSMNPRTHFAIAVTFLVIVIGNSLQDYLHSLNPEPALTFHQIQVEFTVELIGRLGFQAPITVLVWNFILHPIVGLPRIGYWKALGIIAAFALIAG